MTSDPNAPTVDRRTFVGTSAAYVIATALAAACAGETTAPGTATPPTGGGTTPGGGGSGASQAGVTISGSTVSVNVVAAGIGSTGQYLILTGADAIVINTGSGFVALSKTCTHNGCALARFNTSSSLLECDCHGSRFRTSGQVANGPAVTALRSYAVTVTSGVVTFTV